MTKSKEKEVVTSVTWLPEGAAGSNIQHMEVGDGVATFNPFILTEKQQTVDTGAALIQKAWEDGKITDEQALEAMRRAERVNRSVGRDILYDNRLLAKNRVARYLVWAQSQGMNLEEARKFAIAEILNQAKQQNGFGGNNRGGVTKVLDIRD